jgi:hypothetical protein
VPKESDNRPTVKTVSWRRDFERRSVGVLRRLAALPRWAIVFAVVAALLIGLLASGLWGVLMLTVLALFLGWLLLLSWPALAPPARLPRAIVVVALLVVAATRLRS